MLPKIGESSCVADDQNFEEVAEGFLINPDFSGPRLMGITARATRRFGRFANAEATVVAVIALGGALGACARYGLLSAFPETSGEVPWTIMSINVSGSLALGFVLFILLQRKHQAKLLRFFIATGVIGAYTTFSTFTVQVVQAAQHGQVLLAGTYLAASLILGLGAVITGNALAAQLLRRIGRRTTRT